MDGKEEEDVEIGHFESCNEKVEKISLSLYHYIIAYIL